MSGRDDIHEDQRDDPTRDAAESELSMPVGRPGQTPGVVDLTPDEGPQRVERPTPDVAGGAGPADAANATLGLGERSVAREPGPADESNAALRVPPDVS